MSRGITSIFARLARLTRMLGRSREEKGGRAISMSEWVTVGEGGPVPLLEMYRDLLSQQAIPAIITDSGVGRGALGGVPGYGSLRVPAQHAEVARELLRTEDAGSARQVHPQSERIVDRGE